MRVADFGRLHRYERGGVVHGLTRVRSFCQDDAHIFCTPDADPGEDRGASSISLLRRLRRASASATSASSSRRGPEKRIGTDEQLGQGRAARSPSALETRGLPYEVVARRGRVLRPQDRVPRRRRASAQLAARHDPGRLRLPERFDLEYIGEDGTAHRPVMLHRAILGSLERFFGVYIEHVAGAFPVWLAPEQVALVTVSEKQTRRTRTRSLGVSARPRARASSTRSSEPTSSARRFATRA